MWEICSRGTGDYLCVHTWTHTQTHTCTQEQIRSLPWRTNSGSRLSLLSMRRNHQSKVLQTRPPGQILFCWETFRGASNQKLKVKLELDFLSSRVKDGLFFLLKPVNLREHRLTVSVPTDGAAQSCVHIAEPSWTGGTLEMMEVRGWIMLRPNRPQKSDFRWSRNSALKTSATAWKLKLQNIRKCWNFYNS